MEKASMDVILEMLFVLTLSKEIFRVKRRLFSMTRLYL